MHDLGYERSLCLPWFCAMLIMRNYGGKKDAENCRL